MDRASACGAEGRRFESSRDHHKFIEQVAEPVLSVAEGFNSCRDHHKKTRTFGPRFFIEDGYGYFPPTRLRK